MSSEESAIEKSLELLEEGADSELAEAIPYFEKAYKAYRWVKSWRMKCFIKSLGKAAESLGEREKQRLDEIIASQEGAELLTQYADSVLKTSSKTAITALALLYADQDDSTYSEEFKRQACTSLDGISDHEVGFFLELLNACENMRDDQYSDSPYPLYDLAQVEEKSASLNNLEESYEEKVVIVNSLIRRGILLPKYGMRLPVVKSEEEEKSPMFEFGVPKWSNRLAHLLQEAENYRDL